MGSSREEVLRLDRWLHPGFPLHLPVHVDLKGGVRRVRCLHRPQEVLLESYSIFPSARLLNQNQFSMTKRIQLVKINTSQCFVIKRCVDNFQFSAEKLKSFGKHPCIKTDVNVCTLFIT